MEVRRSQSTIEARGAAFRVHLRGRFRQHMVVKGENRDTAWFAITDTEWPGVSAGLQAWLDPANFDDEGGQGRRLEEFQGNEA